MACEIEMYGHPEMPLAYLPGRIQGLMRVGVKPCGQPTVTTMDIDGASVQLCERHYKGAAQRWGNLGSAGMRRKGDAIC